MSTDRDHKEKVMTQDRPELFIDGAFTAGSGEPITVINPSTAQPLGTAATGSAEDIDRAVAAARSAFPAWAATPAEERAAILEKFSAALASRSSETARLCSQENGMPITISESVNGQAPAGVTAMYASLARGFTYEEERPGPAGPTQVRRVPVGVVAALSPWNYPQTLAIMKIAPALAAGCTVVYKAALETPLDAFVFADAALEAGLPAGVLNVVPAGLDASRHLVSHPGVDKVAFTGSTAGGRAIAQVCGSLLRPVTLELGGKSAGIVLDDVDASILAKGLFNASFINNGQTCYASTRLLVPTGRYDEIVEVVAQTVSSFTVGDALDRETLIGPMATQAHQRRVLDYIEKGRTSGARLVTGGGPVDGLDGFFVRPTVFADVENDAVIAREEIFGPVLSIIRYDGTDDQAVDLANDNDYGLGGTVWSSDQERAESVARRIVTGTIGINDYTLDLGSPFGGVKASGYGRELGPEGFTAYLQYQSIYRATA